jgi:hypothetical protein
MKYRMNFLALIPLVLLGTGFALSRPHISSPSSKVTCDGEKLYVMRLWEDPSGYYMTLGDGMVRTYARIKDHQIQVWGLVQPGDAVDVEYCSDGNYVSFSVERSPIDIHP